MLRAFASWVFLLTAIVIGLGAFGHASNAAKLTTAFASSPAFDTRSVQVIFAVWHFCSGCMLVFGAICVWTWLRARRAQPTFFASDAIGVFYIAAGLATVWFTGMGFFWLFVVLGASLLICARILRTTR